MHEQIPQLLQSQSPVLIVLFGLLVIFTGWVINAIFLLIAAHLLNVKDATFKISFIAEVCTAVAVLLLSILAVGVLVYFQSPPSGLVSIILGFISLLMYIYIIAYFLQISFGRSLAICFVSWLIKMLLTVAAMIMFKDQIFAFYESVGLQLQ
ncbi:hypothetical protein RHO12_03705 [Orbus sturtevantii]|uniref:hypothetical protein n=1 Tax=Orbus sturtevantii TaxID=3074109 RepID=UPI00370DACEC